MPNNSISHWLVQLKSGNTDAAGPIWQQYFPKMVEIARKKLADFPRRMADEEDVALSAFNSFCQDAAKGLLPRLENRDDLWRILLMITAQKTIDLIRRETAAKRGGKVARTERELRDAIGKEPSPAFAAMMADEFRNLLDLLPDDDLKTIAVCKMEGLSNDEIAKRLGFVPRTIERRLKVIRTLWGGEADHESRRSK